MELNVSNIILLFQYEKEKFDKPPTLPSEFRTTYFAITKELEIQIKRLNTKTNKIGFLLQYGFFKACKKFFAIHQFSKSDFKYAANLLNLNINAVDITQYKNKIPVNYQTIILKLLGYKSFDKSVIKWLTKEITLIECNNF